MPEIDIASYFPSAFACPDDERVLLSTRYFLLFDRIRNSVFTDQPLPRRAVDEGHVDCVPILSAELLKGSVGNKCIYQFQLSG
jgi:hypothetical protein